MSKNIVKLWQTACLSNNKVLQRVVWERRIENV